MSIQLPEFKMLFEHSPSLMLVLEPDLSIVAVTDAYLNATMTQRDNIIGKGIFEVFPDNPDDKGATGVRNLRASLESVLETRERDVMAIQRYDIKVHKGGQEVFEERFWSPVNTPVLDQHGEVTYIIHKVENVTDFVHMQQINLKQKNTSEELKAQTVLMGIEITKRGEELKDANIALNEANRQLRQTTAELKRSNNELNIFASTAAHDIKAPFRAVNGYLEIIERELKKNDASGQILSYFSKVSDARDRIATLLDNLLKYAQVNEHGFVFNRIDTNDVIAEATRNLEYVIKEKAANINITGAMPAVLGDRTLLIQLFQNIIGNGIKFQKERIPEINISSSANGGYAQFTIEDNGIGIEPKYFETVFQVFQRLHSQSEFEGTGLGLTICKRIVEKHEGKIWIESTVGVGTRFHFTLLLADAKEQEKSPPQLKPAQLMESQKP